MNRQFSQLTFIVDDDPFWTALLTQVLTDLGYTNIETFSNGKDCINNLSKNPGLVFLDYQMPGMDGLQVLTEIKSDHSETVVVFCTDQKELSVAVTAMKNGAFDYLVKSGAGNEALAAVIRGISDSIVFTEKVF